MTAPISVTISKLVAADAIAIERQPSQRMAAGMVQSMTIAAAELYESDADSWTARDAGGRILACYGLREIFPAMTGVAWAIFAPGIGAAHLTITRHVRARIAASSLVRIEAMVDVTNDRAMTFAQLAGLAPRYLVEKFGMAGEPHMLFESIAGRER